MSEEKEKIEAGVVKKRKTIRIPKESGMKKAIEKVALKKNLSINGYIQNALVDAIDDPIRFRMQ